MNLYAKTNSAAVMEVAAAAAAKTETTTTTTMMMQMSCFHKDVWLRVYLYVRSDGAGVELL